MALGCDVLVIGGGSAGSVLARRLSDDPAVRVILVEAGPAAESLMVRMPAGFAYAISSRRFDWLYESEPEPGLGGRTVPCPRGKVLGGSSSINGLGFIRGHPLDFERWAEDGASGWSYREVLPYFRRSESWDGGANDYRGGDGPVRVMTPGCREPLYAMFLEAGRAARCWAAPPASTGSVSSVAIRSTSSAGLRMARRAGPTARCCPISAARKAGTGAPTTIAAGTGQSAS